MAGADQGGEGKGGGGKGGGRVLPIGGQAQGRCPLCGKPAATRYRPFCSRRCADRDLHKWLSEGYAIPTEEAPAEPTPEGEERNG